ncbi:hypothetical protein BKA64DRAFT_704589 [Cadophora sp. MPI-SDFR-AT-0126]|nr:hypothetical protein BKA64DRAFT_704589 [Leotiomycetes sp. MPI-SDFR-AT-0126]
MAEPSQITKPSSSHSSNTSLLRGGPTKPDNPFIFPRGDVSIKVKVDGGIIVGKVVSGAMSLAIWDMFLHPPWHSEDDSPVTNIDFSEDDSDALLILLRIVHFQNKLVPTSFQGSILPLYNLAHLCEEYDCHHLVWLFLNGWRKRLLDTALPLYAGDTRRKAYIAWAFGWADIFLDLGLTLVKKGRVQENGTLEDDEGILPDKLLESIQAVRESTLEKLLSIPYKHLRTLASTKKSNCNDDRCNAKLHENLVSALQERNLWPKKKPRDILDSISFIAGLIEDLEVEYPELPKKDKLGDNAECITLIHYKCDIDYGYDARRIMDRIPDPALECHFRHMKLRSGTSFSEEVDAAPIDSSKDSSEDVVFLHSKSRRQSGGVRKNPMRHKHKLCSRCQIRHAASLSCSLYRP